MCFFWWLKLVRLHALHKILYPKRRIKSYSILGTIVSPSKMLFISCEGLAGSGTDHGALLAVFIC